MKRSDIENMVTEMLDPILEELNFELVDVEYIKEGPNMYLRIYIDKPGGINIDDCQKVSEQVSELLDEKDPIEENYFLEVSSPGLDRPLKKEKDFQSSIGKDVEISLYKPLNGKKKFAGKLLKFDNEKVYIEDDTIGEIAIERESISKINLAIIF
ncbi:ribosome maturation factor RimP [Gottschalkia purinilytica]|uniref:Ribosome maturation factor RimP n=1 Tax=Gottschalkia purinilytica TaxID=1503 RepID=A0A0L0WBI7_GOTPU|nr:ribosome maturation factor RimP [Gottschalkia purinilytica]KNF08858.1 ribosome maturation factor RimP [Gottschalkia purinilytica]